MSLWMILGAMLQSATPPPSPQNPTVIVTAQRLEALEARLAACIARRCPPDQEIDAALALVERQFVDGDYQAAFRTAQRSLGRNRRHARHYPVAVADLQRSYSRVASHRGERTIDRFATRGILLALQAGLPDDDPRLIGASLELADMYVRIGEVLPAHQLYRRAVRRARTAGDSQLLGQALLRLTMVNAALEIPDRESAAMLRELSQGPGMAHLAFASRLIKARRAAAKGDTAAIDRVLAELPPENARPVLLFAPPPRINVDGGKRQADAIRIQDYARGEAVTDQWIDVGIWIAPDGRVSEASVLRRSPKIDGPWPEILLQAVRGRRYSPFQAADGDPGVFRVERLTFTADWVLEGKWIVRSARKKVETLDLTEEAGAPTPPQPPR